MRTTVDDILGFLVEQGELYRADLCYTHEKNDAYRYAAEIREGEYDLVLAVGGDGTVNEVVNGLMASQSGVPLAVLPAGTVNDFANYLGIPSEPHLYAKMLIDGCVVPMDVGRAGNHYFLNVAAGGLLTDIAYRVPSEAKTSLGRMAYWLEGAKDIPQNIFSGFCLRAVSVDPVLLDDTERNGSETCEFEGDALLFIVSNTTSVGGMRRLLPNARPNDGLLDVLIISRLEFGGFLPLITKFLIGDHLSNENVTYFQTRKLTVETTCPHELRLDVDGEEGDLLPVVIECIPGAIPVLVPQDSELLDPAQITARNQSEKISS